MILPAPPADIIKNAREYDYFNVTCDLCGVLAAGNHTYRCDACDGTYVSSAQIRQSRH